MGNPYHDELGRFTDGPSGGAGSAAKKITKDLSKIKVVNDEVVKNGFGSDRIARAYASQASAHFKAGDHKALNDLYGSMSPDQVVHMNSILNSPSGHIESAKGPKAGNRLDRMQARRDASDDLRNEKRMQMGLKPVKSTMVREEIKFRNSPAGKAERESYDKAVRKVEARKLRKAKRVKKG